MTELQDSVMRVVLREFYGEVDSDDPCNEWMVESADHVARKVLMLTEEHHACRERSDLGDDVFYCLRWMGHGGPHIYAFQVPVLAVEL